MCACACVCTSVRMCVYAHPHKTVFLLITPSPFPRKIHIIMCSKQIVELRGNHNARVHIVRLTAIESKTGVLTLDNFGRAIAVLVSGVEDRWELAVDRIRKMEQIPASMDKHLDVLRIHQSKCRIFGIWCRCRNHRLVYYRLQINLTWKSLYNPVSLQYIIFL